MRDLKEHYHVYNDDYYEVAINSKNAVIHDKLSNKYYGTRSTSVPAEIARLSQEHSSVFSVRTSLFGAASIVVLLITNMIISMRSSTVVTPHFFLWFVPYMIFSVTLHEGAHVVALRICGRKPDKIGLKMNYLIFPAFYVRMNQVLLLPVSDKVLVHIAGIWPILQQICSYFTQRYVSSQFRSRILASIRRFNTVRQCAACAKLRRL